MTERAQAFSSAAHSYATTLQDLLARALRDEEASVQAAGLVIARCFDADGLLYIFGSGHSHMFAEEAFYRAGGAARVCPVLKPPYMLHEGAVRSTRLEREEGHAEQILSGYTLDPDRDCMLVVSNSGANALPLEMASTVKRMGLPVIAITSVQYAESIQRPGPRLHQVTDVVIDNHCPPGDAIIRISPADDLPRMGPASTVVGLALLNAMIVDACSQQLNNGNKPDLFVSANMPGALQHNQRVTESLSARIPHL